MSEELSQNSGEFTGSSEYNVLDFVIRSIVCGLVNTAIPVRVDKVERPAEGGGAGYLSATPLIKMRSAKGDALDVVSIPKLRWFRLQHGTAAIIVDPKPGDIGLAVFAQQDVSALNGGSSLVPSAATASRMAFTSVDSGGRSRQLLYALRTTDRLR